MTDKKDKVTHIYSYQVTMMVLIVADSAEEARAQLDEKGGIVTKREVELLHNAPLYGEKENE